MYHCSTSIVLDDNNNSSIFKGSLYKHKQDKKSSLPDDYFPLVSLFSCMNADVMRIRIYEKLWDQYDTLRIGRIKFGIAKQCKFVYRVLSNVGNLSGGATAFGYMAGSSIVATTISGMWCVDGKNTLIDSADIRFVPSEIFEYPPKTSSSTSSTSTKRGRNNKGKSTRNRNKRRHRNHQKTCKGKEQ